MNPAWPPPSNPDRPEGPLPPEAFRSDTDAPDGTTPTALPVMASVALVATGGAAGAACRYELGLLFPVTTTGFPLATMLVNLSGAAALGLLLGLFTGRATARWWAVLGRPLLATGFIGAYTTWSTFMLQTVDLTRAGSAATAFAYLAVSLVGGLAAATGGVSLAGRLTR